ncbi:MAG: NADH-quinone oxidoreductase subunit L [Gammaproteobacteria bacterium]|nr:NADH-quinone oxidoreductase subunit L [Gammaproteobacteria bacterium]
MSIYTLIPFLPLTAALLLVLFGERLQGTGHRLVIPAVALSFLVSIVAFLDVSANGAIEVQLYQFLNVGRLSVDLGFYLDQLTVLILLLVTGVSTIVQVYSSRYMIGDPRHSRFFALTALFTAAMTLLVMSSNLLMTFIFWELMGLCSYLLISHYAERPSAARAATKVFLVNSIADVGLGIGVILTFLTFGTLDIPEILALAKAGGDIPTQSITLITLCLFCGAIGKSAQMPAHIWLPFAMEAPTPVSALIHAATMVNAGPFLLVRLSPVIVLSPTAMMVIAAVGAITALFAALVSSTQTDVKRTLAYSTISQLGFMTMLCGLGAFVAAIFHLIAHGFFKAFLFLSTGNVLAATHRDVEEEEQNPQHAKSGLFIGALIMSVIPALVIFSGPYRYLWLSQNFTAANIALWVIGLGTIFFTSIYLFKSVTTIFLRSPPGAKDGAPTATPALFSAQHVFGVIVISTVIVALLIVVWRWFAGFLSPVVGGIPIQPAMEFSAWIMVPLVAALAGWIVAYMRFVRPKTHQTPMWRKRLYVFFLNKGYFDEVYDVFLVRPTIKLADWMWRQIDQGIIDRLVVSIGSVSIGIARRLGYLDSAVDNQVTSIGTGSVGIARWLGRFVDTAGISNTVDGLGRGVDASGRTARRYEPHTLQHNLLVVVIWLIAALGFFYLTVG